MWCLMLAGLQERQEQIIQLLLTPQGRRESDLGSFPIKPDVIAAHEDSSVSKKSTNKNKKSSKKKN